MSIVTSMRLHRSLLFICLALSCTTGAQIRFESDFVSTKTEAFGLLPADLICGPTVERVIWSQDGTRLMALRTYPVYSDAYLRGLANGLHEEPPKRGEIVVWDIERRKPKTIFTFDLATVSVNHCEWLAGSATIVASIVFHVPGTKPTRKIEFISAEDGSTRVVHEDSDKHSALVAVSPTDPVATLACLLGTDDRQTVEMYLIDADGHLSARSSLSLTPGGLSMPGFGKNGDGPFYFEYPGGPLRSETHRHRFVANGNMVEDSQVFEMPQSGSQLNLPEGLKLTTEPVSTPTGLLHKKALWLVAGPEPSSRILVAADGGMYYLAPFGTGVAYTQEGWLATRRLMRIPLETYLRGATAEAKARATATCEKASSILQQIVPEIKGAFPRSEDWNTFVRTMKSQPWDPPFAYLYDGEIISLANRREVTIGECATQFGVAKLHADFSVEWIPLPAQNSH